MKTKKMKLSLNKSTVANLNNRDMRGVQGGYSEGGITLPPCTETNEPTCDTCNVTCGCATVELDCPSRNAQITCPCDTEIPC